MKWLLLSDDAYLRGGLQTCIREIARAAIDRGHKVRIVCLQRNPFESLAEEHPDECKVSVVKRVEPRSLRPASLLSALKIIGSERPDALFCCTTGMPNFHAFLVAARLLGVRHRIVQFGTEVANPDGQLGASQWGREAVLSARLAYRYMTLGLFNNTTQLTNWRAAYGWPAERCQLWNYPVNLTRFRPDPVARQRTRRALGIREDEFVIGGVGALNPQKSFDLAARALGHFVQQVPKAKLVIAGDGDRATVLQAAEEAGVSDRVLLLGERDDVPDLMRAFDVLCMPSAHPNETLGIVFVEAQACGTPIAVPNLPGPRRVALDGAAGTIFEAGDVRAIADAWTKLYAQPEYREEQVRRGTLNARESDRTTVFDGLIDRIQTVSKSKCAASDSQQVMSTSTNSAKHCQLHTIRR